MNKLDFLIMQLKAEQTFRAIMERMEQNFEVQQNANPQDLSQDNSAGQRLNPAQPVNVPGGDVYASPPTE